MCKGFLTCVGATLFTILSFRLGWPNDRVRIAANIVSGVGFLGAAAILRGPERIVGLKTACTIWLAAALGMGIGGGQYLLADFAAIVGFVVLSLFPRIESWNFDVRDARTYEVVCPISTELFEELEGEIVDCGRKVRQHKRSKADGEMVCTRHVYGSPKGHDRLTERPFARPDVIKFSV